MVDTLKELIEEGKQLDQKRKEKLNDESIPEYMKKYKRRLNIMTGDDFKLWVSKSINYLEKNHSEKSTVKDIIESYSHLSDGNSYNFYKELMNVLKSLSN